MTNNNRTKSLVFRKLVALWLKAEGLPVHARPYLIRQAHQLAGDDERGHLRGLPGVLLNTHNEKEFLIGEQVERAKRDALEGEKALYFSVQRRSGREVEDALVFTDLRTLAAVLKRLEAAS